jgi:hypothetical protein
LPVAEDGVTVAVRVTVWKYVDGLPELVNVTVTGVVEAAITIEKLCAAETLPAVSLAVTVKLNGLPVIVLGDPLIAPVAVFSVRPGGSEPEATAHV